MRALLDKRRVRQPIGVDIGRSGVRAVQLRRSGEEFALAAHATLEWDAPSLEGDGHIGQAMRWLARFGRQPPFRGNAVVAALPTNQVELHALDLPQTVLDEGGAELKRSIRFEIEHLTGEPTDMLELGAWPLPPGQGNVPKAMAIAAPRKQVTDNCNSFAYARMCCKAIEVDAMALARGAMLLAHRQPGDVWGALDLGHTESRIIVNVGDTTIVARRAGSGQADWTDRIATALNISKKSAEVQKYAHGFSLDGRGVRRDDEAPPDQQVAAIITGVLRPELTSLAAEIKRSFEYVLGCYPKADVAGLVLAGTGARLGNLNTLLEGLLGISIRCARELIASGEGGLQVPPAFSTDRADLLLTAMGLSAGGPE